MKFFKTYILFFIFLVTGSVSISAQCTVNAGASGTICGTTYTLDGSVSGDAVGNPTWSLVSKPAGAPDPVISNINAYKPNVTGLTYPGNYVFRISQTCNTGPTSSDVTITAPGDASTFTAGADQTTTLATVGTVNLTGVVPAGYTAQWSAYNIWRREYFGTTVNTNATFGSPTSASTSFTLTKKADHNEDPAYVVTLRITSITNPNCYYEDTAIVRFIPNPQIVVPTTYSRCWNSTEQKYLPFSSTSPIFSSTTNGAAGSTNNNTIITMNVISQPSGGNITYGNFNNGNIWLNGVTVPGDYRITFTITNAAGGTYTTPVITYTYPGLLPSYPFFSVASEPKQMTTYYASSTGGEVQCNMAGSTTPITFRFTINAADSPTLVTTVIPNGIIPPGGAPSIVTAGNGTRDRSATVTPPAGGWRVGTYRFNLATSTPCGTQLSQEYYIHISDGARPNVSVNNMVVCYPGTGVVTATVPLPAVYQGVVNSSYFQDFRGRYDFTVVSKPAGSGIPTFEAANLRTLTSTSTVIGNLTTPGAYTFNIKAVPNAGGVGPFLDREYACSGTSLEGTFTITVSPQVNANAGSDQNVICNTAVTLAGNNPTPGTGAWTVVSAPSGATPVFANASLYNTTVTGMTLPGTYTLRWTITTGTCTGYDDVDVVIAACPTISGTVFNDINANTVIDSRESGISAGTSYVYLVNSSGVIVNSVAVASNGAYSINVGTNQNYTLHLSSNVYSIGSNISTTPINHTIPGWVTTGENKNNNTGSGDGTPDGIISATVVTSSLSNYNFGVRACPAGTEPPVLNSKTS
ncbi:hypothetical protein [Epilithonimonas xixisoli]|uniref:SprB-like repeat protein n=1 Tax=Epilithonimonas xixisoli TaxID=1476462 RepID=A0A4R8IKR0_9FLAO|nr:hypothetical protein [Epilithonimonas xixisoli]TDX87259.1 hypothetical protein B0I22_1447 [Epilithonimonas xixisoli]